MKSKHPSVDKATLAFLRDLKKNNNKDWFEKNKERYLKAFENISEVTSALLKELGKMDKGYLGLTPKDCLFRIYRDVRFSKDKTPYKTNIGASINTQGKKAIQAGYYLHVDATQSFIAGGIWMPPGDALKKIRQEIDYNPKPLKKLLADKAFKKYFGSLDETYRVKTTPKGYAKDHPEIELLRYNSFIAWHSFTDKEMTGERFVSEVSKAAKVMKPLIDYLNVAIS